MQIDAVRLPSGYLTPKARGGTVLATGQLGVYAHANIDSGELIAVWGGDVMPTTGFDALPSERRRLALQVDEELYIVSGTEGPADWINHCCAPNAGMQGQISLVAMRPIATGEEICFDYAMTDGSPYDEFTCRCGSPRCRGRVTGNDWQLPELQHAYGDYFSPYLRRRQVVTHAPELQTSAVGLPRPTATALLDTVVPRESKRADQVQGFRS